MLVKRFWELLVLSASRSHFCGTSSDRTSKEPAMVVSRAPEDSTCSLVSDAVSALYLEKFGRGPMQARTFIHDDVVVTLLGEVFTPAEKALDLAGKRDSVLTTRVLWQHSTD